MRHYASNYVYIEGPNNSLSVLNYADLSPYTTIDTAGVDIISMLELPAIDTVLFG